jgi:hypothetical protein
MDNKVKELQAELDNVAAVLRSYAAENLKIYKEAKEELGEDSRLAIAKKATLDEITNIMEELGVEWHLPNFYFTFGTAEQYPYTIGQYLIVKARDIREAAQKYKRKYPNPHDDAVLNCADYYGQEEWDGYVKEYYEGTEPAEIIE